MVSGDTFHVFLSDTVFKERLSHGFHWLTVNSCKPCSTCFCPVWKNNLLMCFSLLWWAIIPLCFEFPWVLTDTAKLRFNIAFESCLLKSSNSKKYLSWGLLLKVSWINSKVWSAASSHVWNFWELKVALKFEYDSQITLKSLSTQLQWFKLRLVLVEKQEWVRHFSIRCRDYHSGNIERWAERWTWCGCGIWNDDLSNALLLHVQTLSKTNQARHKLIQTKEHLSVSWSKVGRSCMVLDVSELSQNS